MVTRRTNCQNSGALSKTVAPECVLASIAATRVFNQILFCGPASGFQRLFEARVAALGKTGAGQKLLAGIGALARLARLQGGGAAGTGMGCCRRFGGIGLLFPRQGAEGGQGRLVLRGERRGTERSKGWVMLRRPLVALAPDPHDRAWRRPLLPPSGPGGLLQLDRCQGIVIEGGFAPLAPGFVRGYAFALQLWNQYDMVTEKPVELFATADAARALPMYFGYDLDYTTLHIRAPHLRDQIGIFPFPHAAGRPALTEMGGRTVVIFRDARNPQGAMRWIEFLMSTEAQLYRYHYFR